MIGITFASRSASVRRSSRVNGFGRAARQLLAAVLVLACASQATAQIPKSFKYHEDASDLGFKIKVPADWEFIPGSPADVNLIGKYDGNADQGIQLGKYQPWQYSVWLVKFDRRKGAGQVSKEGELPIEIRGPKNVEEYLPQLGIRGSWKKVDKEGGALGIAGVEANASVYATVFEKAPLRLYVASYKLSPDLDIALIANASGDDKKWAKHESVFNTMGKSFKKLELKTAEVAAAKAGDSPLRSRKRAELDAKIKAQPGWKLYETPNYFIVSNNTDKEFIDELLMRLEAIRKAYEEYYPVDKALELRRRRAEALAKKKAESPPEPGEPGSEGKDDPPPGTHTEVQGATPLEQSRCSVVRVVQNEDQYHSYGGPQGSAGYWNWFEEELVVYDDQASGGRGDTWATLNHEAFHQYIFYLVGNLSPHSWFNEGTGDFYAGYQLKNGRFELKPFDWRVQTIKAALRERGSGLETFVPLKKLARFVQKDYYEPKTVVRNYAQGWSFIWFLRQGPKNCRAWNKAWNSILDVYLETLAVTNDLDEAVDKAFAGVDWDEMEKAWIDYTLAL
ncbi:MAG TPA: hypothetical protein VM509_01500 [Planctomycetota bacterium]|nr:hypothetical protein [Planctomycetota bacterium]